MNIMPFIHIHTHTTYTSGNSSLTIAAMLQKCRDCNMTATAIVDSGTIAGFDEFTQECRRQNISPIYGCGFYLAKGSHRLPAGRSHLVLLVYNQDGMDNLRALDSIAQSDGFHDGKAHIDDELLAAHSAGLICLSGGLGGDIDKLITVDDLPAATKRALFYKNIFGANFYLERQNHGSAKNSTALAGLQAIRYATGIPQAVSQGAFYLNSSDAAACNELRLDNQNKALSGNQYHFRTSEEMYALFNDSPEALKNTAYIAERCLAYLG